MSGNVDARAIQQLARDLWAGLTTAQRDALRRARAIEGGYRLDSPTPVRTTRALWGKLLIVEGASVLEPLGLLVRAEGLAADRAAARRRFNRRKATLKAVTGV
jgi:hypothetical protein